MQGLPDGFPWKGEHREEVACECLESHYRPLENILKYPLLIGILRVLSPLTVAELIRLASSNRKDI